MTSPSFDAVAEALDEAESLAGAAELHGQLCGLYCVLGPAAVPAWMAEIPGGGGSPPAAASGVLDTLARATWQALDAGDMSLELLVPGDEQPLDLRTESLGAWCQGFMHGLGGAAGRHPALEAGGTGEILRDFGEISRATLGAEEADQEGEAAYTELVEFVRVSVQLVFEELHALRSPGELH